MEKMLVVMFIKLLDKMLVLMFFKLLEEMLVLIFFSYYHMKCSVSTVLKLLGEILVKMFLKTNFHFLFKESVVFLLLFFLVR